MSNIGNLINKEFSVLDKGFIRVVDCMGDDHSIVQAARVSYGQGTKSVNQDEGLIKYLLRHSHTTPFEMCEIKLHVKAPIFIARQWLRHRTANVNEISARYSILSEDFYLPSVDQICEQSNLNKQGRTNRISDDISEDIIGEMRDILGNAFHKYNEFMSKHNLTRELARIILPVAVYTEFYWKIDLHNLLHFLHLRCGIGAQKEIRDYANIILNEIVKEWVPITYGAFIDYKVNSATFSGSEIDEIVKIMDAEKLNELIDKCNTLKGEKKEFAQKLSILAKKINNS